MVITAVYDPATRTVIVTDTTVYAPGDRENLNLFLLVDGTEVATFEVNSDTVSHTFTSDGIYALQVKSYDSFTGDLVETSNTLRTLVTEYGYADSISLYKKAIQRKLSFQPFLDNIILLKSARYYYENGNYPKAKQVLNYYANAR